MGEEHVSRSARYAADFEAAQEELIRLLASLTDEQWRMVGRNYPRRLNDEDENRPIGVIAHHVAVTQPWIMNRIEGMLAGRTLPPPDLDNARHAAEHATVSREAVVQLLRENGPRIASAVRAIPDDQLDQLRDTPVGPMSVAQRLERVLVGHIKVHQGSIEAAIA